MHFLIMFSNSALELLSSEVDDATIITLIKGFDYLLGHQLTFGSITEFCGISGSGKTQLWLVFSLKVKKCFF